MCGFFMAFGPSASSKLLSPMMRERLILRGPDGYHEYEDARIGLYAFHARLAIQDLNPRSNQPFLYSNKYLIVFNGEIYNFKEIKKDLVSLGFKFKTSGDTEVICAAFSFYGTRCFDLFRGMFSLVIIDLISLVIVAARDHAGQKPLFFRIRKDGTIVLSSTLILDIDEPNTIDRKSLDHFLRGGYLTSEETFVNECQSVKPGCFLLKDPKKRSVEEAAWYNLPDVDRTNSLLSDAHSGELVQEFWMYFTKSLERCLVSDRKVSIAFSGGLDSSCVAIAAEKEGFNGSYISINSDAENSLLISSVSAYLQIQPTIVDYQGEELTVLLEKALSAMDEPLADSSIIPTYMLMRVAGQRSPVLLLGDGADELFGGYHHQLAYLRATKFLKPFRASKNSIPRAFLSRWLGRKAERFLFLISSKGWPYSHLNLFSPRERLAFGAKLTYDDNEATEINPLYNDFKNYLPNDLLKKTDRLGMVNGVECRSPFLDRDLVDFAYSLDLGASMLEHQSTKPFLKNAMRPYMPADYPFEGKKGFSLEKNQFWANAKFREYAYETLKGAGLFGDKTSQLVFTNAESNLDFERLFAALSLSIWCKNNGLTL